MKFRAYLLCFVLIVSGIFCGISFAKLYFRESATNGSGIDVEYVYDMESFRFASIGIPFVDDLYSDAYTYESELLPVEDFDGEEKQYQLVLNDFVCQDTIVDAGYILGEYTFNFYDLHGDVACESTISIRINFYVNHTDLIITCNDGAVATTYWTSYFNDFGVVITVNEII